MLNRTHTGMSGRLQVPVSVAYDTDPKRVEAILLDDRREPSAGAAGARRRGCCSWSSGPDSMNFELRCWLRDVNFSLSARSDMNFEIVERLRAARASASRFYGRDLPPEAAAGAARRRPSRRASKPGDRQAADADGELDFAPALRDIRGFRAASGARGQRRYDKRAVRRRGARAPRNAGRAGAAGRG